MIDNLSGQMATLGTPVLHPLLHLVHPQPPEETEINIQVAVHQMVVLVKVRNQELVVVALQGLSSPCSSLEL